MLSHSNATTLIRQRSGFTLIELLIVMTILGILATIAVGKIGRTRERAYFKAIMSDLRNLQAQQETYFATATNNYQYASDVANISNFAVSPGVEVVITAFGNSGWGATASHASLTGSQSCAVFIGTVATVPAPASTPGVVTCTGE